MTSEQVAHQQTPAASTIPKVALRIKIKPSNGTAAGKSTLSHPEDSTRVRNGTEAQEVFTEQPPSSATRSLDTPFRPVRPLLKRKQAGDPQVEVKGYKKKSDGTTAPRNRRQNRRIVSDSESDEGSEQPVANAGSQYSAASTAPDTSSTETLINIVSALTVFPTGEVAYGTDSVLMPQPDVEMLNHGVVKPPYDQDQLHSVRKFAKELRAKKFGIDWKTMERTPTWTVPGSCLDITHPEWERFLAGLARQAGKYLGLGNVTLTTRLQNLHLWERDSMWRDHHHNEYYDPTRVGTLLIILNRACMGGEIVIGCGDKEVLFDPASAKQEHFYIASHNKTKHETLPLTAGHRLGLAYDLRLDTHAGKALVHDLLDRLNDAENNLFYNVACCAEEVETQVRENHPLLFVLEKTYEPGAMAVRYLGAADRARVLGVMNVAREVYGGEGGWRLRGYLAAVTREVKILERTGGVGDGLHKYVVDRVVGLEGEVMDEVKETVVVEGRCVLQPEEFESDERRWPDGKTTVSGRSRTCLVLGLEGKEAE